MAKKTYIGVNTIARKVKKIYTGVGDIARNVKKGYIGVDGVARLFFSGILKEVFKPTLATLSNDDEASKSANTKYLLWHTGRIVDAFNKNLVKTNPAVCTPHHAGASTKTHNYFAGNDDSSGGTKSVGVYDNNLTRSSAPELSVKVMYPSGVSVGSYALFGGGTPTHMPSEGTAVVTAYDDSLTKYACTDLLYGTYSTGTSYNDEYAFFIGGIMAQRSTNDYSYGADIIGYNKSLTQFVVARGEVNILGTSVSGCSVGKYAIYYPGYGYTSSGSINNMYGTFIDESLTYMTSVYPTYGVPSGVHATNGEYAYIPNAHNSGSGIYTHHISKVTKDLVFTTIDTERQYVAGASFGNKALLRYSNIFDAYVME